MEARSRVLILLVLILPTLGASARTKNFIVTAQTPALASEMARAAEEMRRDLALEWLGHELPDWQKPCPVVVKVAPNLGAGGRTSFMFHERVPFGWDMEVQGSRERVLDSVLPHEVTHTIFATHFGRPLPRWADEGACTTVEHTSERRKQELWLVRFLKTERGIPFNHMFAMTEYPGDILPLYSQGYSLARYLIAQGGKPKFTEFVGHGLGTGNWQAAVRRYYGFQSLGNLQLRWLDWVVQGSPDTDVVTPPAAPDVILASAAQTVASNSNGVQRPAASTGGRPRPQIDDQLAFATPTAPSAPKAPSGTAVATATVSRNATARSWYARRQTVPRAD